MAGSIQDRDRFGRRFGPFCSFRWRFHPFLLGCTLNLSKHVSRFNHKNALCEVPGVCFLGMILPQWGPHQISRVCGLVVIWLDRRSHSQTTSKWTLGWKYSEIINRFFNKDKSFSHIIMEMENYLYMTKGNTYLEIYPFSTEPWIPGWVRSSVIIGGKNLGWWRWRLEIAGFLHKPKPTEPHVTFQNWRFLGQICFLKEIPSKEYCCRKKLPSKFSP